MNRIAREETRRVFRKSRLNRISAKRAFLFS